MSIISSACQIMNIIQRLRASAQMLRIQLSSNHTELAPFWSCKYQVELVATDDARLTSSLHSQLFGPGPSSGPAVVAYIITASRHGRLCVKSWSHPQARFCQSHSFRPAKTSCSFLADAHSGTAAHISAFLWVLSCPSPCHCLEQAFCVHLRQTAASQPAFSCFPRFHEAGSL